MGDCATCPKGRRMRVERPYKSVPRHVRYSSQPTEPRRYSPLGCDESGCYVASPCASCRPLCPSPCNPPCPCPSPCVDTRCCYYPGESDSGLLHTLRNGFQRIFYGRKRDCAPLCKGKVYNYSTSQLRYMEQHLEKLEEEAYCIESTIKDAFDCDCRINCNELRCSLNSIMDRVEGIRCDLMCAYDCYDPCRDRCEYELICSLLDKCNCLEAHANDLCLQLECLEYQFNCYPCDINCRKPCCYKRPTCKPNCKKPCCYMPACPKPCYRLPCDINCRKACCVKPACDVGCRKPCCVKPIQCEIGCQKPCCIRPMGFECPPRRRRNGNCPKPVCRTSSVIPVGVMLVKL